ncbi:unnamed protein product [Amoebophrya sp. A120]|nr:unnamed protein product [Amoebophrya sp. A120]|eukprot:GSA120T00018672001.1
MARYCSHRRGRRERPQPSVLLLACFKLVIFSCSDGNLRSAFGLPTCGEYVEFLLERPLWAHVSDDRFDQLVMEHEIMLDAVLVQQEQTAVMSTGAGTIKVNETTTSANTMTGEEEVEQEAAIHAEWDELLAAEVDISGENVMLDDDDTGMELQETAIGQHGEEELQDGSSTSPPRGATTSSASPVDETSPLPKEVVSQIFAFTQQATVGQLKILPEDVFYITEEAARVRREAASNLVSATSAVEKQGTKESSGVDQLPCWTLLARLMELLMLLMPQYFLLVLRDSVSSLQKELEQQSAPLILSKELRHWYVKFRSLHNHAVDFNTQLGMTLTGVKNAVRSSLVAGASAAKSSSRSSQESYPAPVRLAFAILQYASKVHQRDRYYECLLGADNNARLGITAGSGSQQDVVATATLSTAGAQEATSGGTTPTSDAPLLTSSISKSNPETNDDDSNEEDEETNFAHNLVAHSLSSGPSRLRRLHDDVFARALNEVDAVAAGRRLEISRLLRTRWSNARGRKDLNESGSGSTSRGFTSCEDLLLQKTIRSTTVPSKGSPASTSTPGVAPVDYSDGKTASTMQLVEELFLSGTSREVAVPQVVATTNRTSSYSTSIIDHSFTSMFTKPVQNDHLAKVSVKTLPTSNIFSFLDTQSLPTEVSEVAINDISSKSNWLLPRNRPRKAVSAGDGATTSPGAVKVLPASSPVSTTSTLSGMSEAMMLSDRRIEQVFLPQVRDVLSDSVRQHRAIQCPQELLDEVERKNGVAVFVEVGGYLGDCGIALAATQLVHRAVLQIDGNLPALQAGEKTLHSVIEGFVRSKRKSRLQVRTKHAYVTGRSGTTAASAAEGKNTNVVVPRKILDPSQNLLRSATNPLAVLHSQIPNAYRGAVLAACGEEGRDYSQRTRIKQEEQELEDINKENECIPAITLDELLLDVSEVKQLFARPADKDNSSSAQQNGAPSTSSSKPGSALRARIPDPEGYNTGRGDFRSREKFALRIKVSGNEDEILSQGMIRILQQQLFHIIHINVTKYCTFQRFLRRYRRNNLSRNKKSSKTSPSQHLMRSKDGVAGALEDDGRRSPLKPVPEQLRQGENKRLPGPPRRTYDDVVTCLQEIVGVLFDAGYHIQSTTKTGTELSFFAEVPEVPWHAFDVLAVLY